MNTKDYLPYEESTQLKKLGFKEPCHFAFDHCSTPMRCTDLRTSEQKFNGVNYNSSSYTSQPTFAQAFRWFRETHQLFHEIQVDQTTYPKYAFEITKFVGNPNDLTEKEWDWQPIAAGLDWCLYREYEEAELACLRKLIKLASEEKIKEEVFEIIRVVDLDGMGGQEYEYHCGNCKIKLKAIEKFCNNCGVKLGEISKRDTWGL